MQSNEEDELKRGLIDPILTHLNTCGDKGSNFEGICQSINGTPQRLPLTYIVDRLIRTREMYYSQGRYYKNPPINLHPEQRSPIV